MLALQPRPAPVGERGEAAGPLNVAQVLSRGGVAGVSDAVIPYMINTGKRTFEEETVDAPAEAVEETAVEESSGGAGDDAYRSRWDDEYRGAVNASFGYSYPHR